MPLSSNKKLLNNADRYCKDEMWPNLKCKLTDPKIILSSFNILINGRWYNPASGRFDESNKKVTKPIVLIINKFLNKAETWISLTKKNNIKLKKKRVELNKGFRLDIKLAINAIKVKIIIPIKIISL